MNKLLPDPGLFLKSFTITFSEAIKNIEDAPPPKLPLILPAAIGAFSVITFPSMCHLLHSQSRTASQTPFLNLLLRTILSIPCLSATSRFLSLPFPFLHLLTWPSPLYFLSTISEPRIVTHLCLPSLISAILYYI